MGKDITTEEKLLTAIFGYLPPKLHKSEQSIHSKYWTCPYCQILCPKFGGNNYLFYQRIKTHLTKVHNLPPADVRQSLKDAGKK